MDPIAGETKPVNKLVNSKPWTLTSVTYLISNLKIKNKYIWQV